MTRAVHITRYGCALCNAVYGTEAEAARCESRPVSKDFGVKVGDLVLVVQGEGAGEKARVESISIIDKDWGHYAWERYWHTVSLTAKMIGSFGHRTLTFDAYKPLP